MCEKVNLLWVSADPGCGKSVLSRALVGEGLLITMSRRPTICYFILKDDDVNRRSGANALCAILHQLFMQKPVLLEHAVLYFKNNGSLLRTTFGTLWDILKKLSWIPKLVKSFASWMPLMNVKKQRWKASSVR
ncbi:hypothetical protein FGG08_002646 [Glutinoglossum americanum]|uniref:Nephrocystin 3-like N-terminal domain-containing protein n=1 Tax=Glutinoglossum americanum TaxID=1670608 RepID=A0A9P8I4G3_9PEZI|nr:hypothetical protein FGG08_002646 [Glutinoglossum americanum]